MRCNNILRVGIVAVLILNGCLNCKYTDFLVIDFLSSETVIANGQEFPLATKEDGFRLMEHFPRIKRVQFKNAQNATFSAMWNIIDCRSNENNFKMLQPRSYEIMLLNGKVKELKFFGRDSDILSLSNGDTDCPINVESDEKFPADFMLKGTNSYLQLWCKVSGAKGVELMNTIERFISIAGDDADVYIMPY